MKNKEEKRDREIRLLKERVKELERLEREYKRTEENLCRSESLLNEAQRIAHIGSWELDIQKNKLVWSDEIYRIFDIDPNVFGASYEAFLNVIHPDDREFVDRAYTKSIQNKTSYDIEHRLLMKDGKVKYVRERCETFYDENERPTSSIGTVQDITESKQAESSLRDSKEKLNALIQSSPSAIIALDLYGNITLWNASASKMYGWEEKEVIGRFPSLIPDHKKSEYYTMSKRVLRGEGFHDVEVVRKKKDGSDIYISLSTAPLRDFAGRINGIMSISNDITERKRAEEALRDSRNMLQIVLNSIPSAVFWKDHDLNYLGANLTWLKAVGMKSSSEVVGKSDYDLPWDKKQADSFREYDRGVMESGISEYNIIETYLQADGTHSWAKTNKVPLFDTENKVVGILGTYEDITERMQAEKALKESERLLKQTGDIAKIGGWEMDLEKGGMATWTKGTYDIVEIEQSEPIPGVNEHIGWYLPEYRGMIGKKMQDLIKTRKPMWFEAMLRTKKGNIKWCKAIGEAVEKDGRVVKLRGTFQDITEYKLDKEMLEKQTFELTALNILAQEVGANLSQKQVVKAAINGILKAVKPDLALIFRREDDKLLLQDFGPKKSKYSHKQTSIHCVGECLCGIAVSSGKTIYVTDITKDPRCTWKECKKAGLKSFVALPLKSGDETIGVLGIASALKRNFEEQSTFIDTLTNEIAVGLQNAMLYEKVQNHAAELKKTVSERTIELKEAVLHLQDLDKLKSIFLASMSHELRTPLNSIIGFTGILLMGMAGELNNEQRKQLEKVKSSASHLLSLINDTLDISKIEAGKVEVYIEEINLKDIIKGVVNNIAPMVKETNLEIKYSVPNNIIIESDERRLRQVLMNLVSNAVKYTDKGNIIIQASLLKEQKVKVKVADTGIGMPKKSLDKLFQPFQQISTSLTKKRGGTGLGLYLCKKLITLLGGSIMVKSEYRKGSEFSFVLPLKNKEKNK